MRCCSRRTRTGYRVLCLLQIQTARPAQSGTSERFNIAADMITSGLAFGHVYIRAHLREGRGEPHPPDRSRMLGPVKESAETRGARPTPPTDINIRGVDTTTAGWRHHTNRAAFQAIRARGKTFLRECRLCALLFFSSLGQNATALNCGRANDRLRRRNESLIRFSHSRASPACCHEGSSNSLEVHRYIIKNVLK